MVLRPPAMAPVERFLLRRAAAGRDPVQERGRYGDGLGLWLQVSKWGTKSWEFRYEREVAPGNRRTHYMGLGPLHTVSLAEARERARQARQLLLDGKDPLEVKHESKAARLRAAASRMTFRECAVLDIGLAKGRGDLRSRLTRSTSWATR